MSIKPESNESRLNNFDLIRLFAATQVMTFHAFAHFHLDAPYLISFFSIFPGVPIFFTISGFLISKSLENHHRLLNYFFARALRIFPALWTVVTLTVIVFGFFGISFFHPEGIKWFTLQLFGGIYTPNFLRHFGIGSYNGALWTIVIEIQFYITIPLLYRFRNQKHFNRLIISIFLASTATSIGINNFLPNFGGPTESLYEKLLRYSIAPHLYLFLLGVIIQRLNIHKSTLIRGKGFFWISVYILLSNLPELSSAMRQGMNILLGVSFISIAYSMPHLSQSILRGNDISYGVYIYHGLIINAFVANWNPSTFGAWSIISLFTLVYSLSIISWKFIEQPALNLKPRFNLPEKQFSGSTATSKPK